jgi:hypothetical protein
MIQSEMFCYLLYITDYSTSTPYIDADIQRPEGSFCLEQILMQAWVSCLGENIRANIASDPLQLHLQYDHGC